MQFLTPLLDQDVLAQLKERTASEDLIIAAIGRMLLALLEYLQSRGPTPQAGVLFLNDQLMITLSHPTRHLSVWIDAKDFGEIRDGMPVMHYRIQISKPEKH